MWRRFAKVLLWVYFGVGLLAALVAACFLGGSVGVAFRNGAVGFLVGLVIFLLLGVLVCFSLCTFGMQLEQADNVAKMTEDLSRTKEAIQNLSSQMGRAQAGGGHNPGAPRSPRPSPADKEQWVCSHCGRVNAGYAKVCPSCGTRKMI